MKEIIILAGGLGTRLQPTLEDTPKVLAPIDGRPFIEYLLDYLEDQWVDHVILALGFKGRDVLEWLKDKAYTFKISISMEQEPLGTGGAIKRALMKSYAPKVAIINGDTYFPIDMNEIFNQEGDFPIHIALTEIEDSSRYGQVVYDEQHVITGFLEKEEQSSPKPAIINAGVYLIDTETLPMDEWPNQFSWEMEVLEPLSKASKIKGILFDAPFIDIGIPEDYEKAQTFIPKHSAS